MPRISARELVSRAWGGGWGWGGYAVQTNTKGRYVHCTTNVKESQSQNICDRTCPIGLSPNIAPRYARHRVCLLHRCPSALTVSTHNEQQHFSTQLKSSRPAQEAPRLKLNGRRKSSLRCKKRGPFWSLRAANIRSRNGRISET